MTDLLCSLYVFIVYFLSNEHVYFIKSEKHVTLIKITVLHSDFSRSPLQNGSPEVWGPLVENNF